MGSLMRKLSEGECWSKPVCCASRMGRLNHVDSDIKQPLYRCACCERKEMSRHVVHTSDRTNPNCLDVGFDTPNRAFRPQAPGSSRTRDDILHVIYIAVPDARVGSLTGRGRSEARDRDSGRIITNLQTKRKRLRTRWALYCI